MDKLRKKKKTKSKDIDIVSYRAFLPRNVLRMNEQACFKYLQRQIESFERMMLKDKEEGNRRGSLFWYSKLEFYQNLYDNLKSDPQFINEFKKIFTNDDIRKNKFREIQIKKLLNMNREFFIEDLQENIRANQQTMEAFNKVQFWPIKREQLEKQLLEDKESLLKLEKDPDFIYKIKEDLTKELHSLKKMNPL